MVYVFGVASNQSINNLTLYMTGLLHLKEQPLLSVFDVTTHG